jgi:hypothetical protein
MSDVVNTAADAVRRAQSQCGGVALSPCGETAGSAPQGSDRQPEACVSRPAPRADHRLVGMRHQHRRPRPRATSDQARFGCTCRSTLTRHGGRGQEQRLVALDGDHPTSVDNTLGPGSAVVPGLARALLRQLRRRAPGRPQVALRSLVSAGPAASGHLRSGLDHFGGATPPRLEVGQTGRRGPTRTSSPHWAAQHRRSSQAMSRTSPTPRPRPHLPMAGAMGFSGAFR